MSEFAGAESPGGHRVTTEPTGTDIALIGMSAMFAKAPNLDTYWHNILERVDAIHDASDDWVQHFLDPNPSDFDRIYTRRGGFLGDRVEFDPMEFGIMPNAIHTADADHFLALKVARDALADAGYGEREFDRENTGVILGRGTMLTRSYSAGAQFVLTDQIVNIVRQLNPSIEPELLEQMRVKLKASLPTLTAEVSPSMVPNVIAGRIANRLNLMGPNYILDGACASALLAVDMAISELISGRCNLVLAGGTQATTPPEIYMLFCVIDALSRSNLRPFDGAANGTLLGEGVGILVLKRLADAERDGDRIYAIVKGAGTASDGRALGLLAPRREGQVLALQRAYKRTGIDPDTISLIEAHGTGIPLGDKTEMETLLQVFGSRGENLPKRAIGSVKSMIGHCIPASGAASLIKMALSLHDKVLPPTICDDVSPELGVEKTSVYVNNVTRPWIQALGQPRRAAVNAFGFGGVNAHVILEEYRPPEGAPRNQAHSRWPFELVAFGAADRGALLDQLKRARSLLERAPTPRLADLARTLVAAATGPWRLAIVCADIVELAAKLDQAAAALSGGDLPKSSPRSGMYFGEARSVEERGATAFLFPGEGGQYEGMLADLCINIPSVRAWFDRLDGALAGHAPVLPSQAIFPPPTTLSEADRARLGRMLMSLEIASASVVAANLALNELLTAMKVRCDAIAGHSTGEFSALVAAGVIRNSTEEDYKKITERFYVAHHELMETQRVPAGTLLTVGAVDAAKLDQRVKSYGGRIHVALENCPNQTVLFGNPGDIDELASGLKSDGAICMPLPFARGYHTELYAETLPILRELYDGVDVGPSRIPIYSCVTAELYPNAIADIRELATRQVCSRVRFRQIIENMYASGVRNFIEVGPGSNLTGFVRDTLQRRPHLAMASNMAGKSSMQQLLHLLARLFVQGADLDFAPLFSHRPVGTVALDPAADYGVARKRRPQLIETLNPRIRLDEKFAAEVRARLAQQAGAHPVTTPTGHLANGADAPAMPNSPAPTIEVAGNDPRAEAVRAHFDLMRAFLDSQAHVMAQFGLATPTTEPPPSGLSSPWMQAETGRICRRVDSASFESPTDAAAGGRLAEAERMLSERELELWRRLPGNSKRRLEWLLGRVAAKEAVRQWAQERRGLRLSATDIAILPSALGKPLVDCPAIAATGLLPDVSISHSHGSIVAALSEPGTHIGIDLARASDLRSAELLRKSFLDPEIALLERKQNDNPTAAVLHFWCAKEAASKSRGEGLGGAPRNWVVEEYAPDAGKVVVTHGGASYHVRFWQLSDEVLAVC